MKKIDNYIIEKLILNKDTKIIKYPHDAEYFPFSLIDKDDCISLKILGNNRFQCTPMIGFRKAMMEIFKKCKYKDFLATYTLNRKETGYMSIGSFSKIGYVEWRLYIYKNQNEDDPLKYIQKNGYTIMQKKIANANYLNANLHPSIIMNDDYIINNIYISWLDNYKCIAINFDLSSIF